MHTSKAISTASALLLAAGILSVPSGTFARGGGAAHGPAFGFHPRIVIHRPLRPAFVHHAPARLGFRLRWFNHRNRTDASAAYPAYGSSGAAYPSDVTGTVPGPGVFVPPVIPPAPAEHIGCLSRGYDVPGENGGVAKVVVTRC